MELDINIEYISTNKDYMDMNEQNYVLKLKLFRAIIDFFCEIKIKFQDCFLLRKCFKLKEDWDLIH